MKSEDLRFAYRFYIHDLYYQARIYSRLPRTSLQKRPHAEVFLASMGCACAVGAMAAFALGLQMRKMNN